MPYSSISSSDKKSLPIMLEIASFIGTAIGMFFSVYYIRLKGIDHALDIGTLWIVESLSLPFAYAGFFFEESFHDGKRFPICNKESSLIYLSFSIAMLVLHYGKFSTPAKLGTSLCFLIYLFFSSLSLFLEMYRKRNFTRYKLFHISLICGTLIFSLCFIWNFLI
jgi:hypothetical protein